MVAVDWSTTVIPLLILAAVAVAALAWLVLARVFGSSRAGRHASHFLDVGGAELDPEDRIKYQNQHAGAGGFG